MHELPVNAATAAFVVAPALALGSFLNVVVARVPAGRSIVRPPSSCMSCGTEILWRDNVPLLSYALLRGRCRYCDARISSTYPIVEALTAILVVTCFAVWGATVEAVLAAGFCSVLVVLSTIDVNERRSASARTMGLPLVPFLSFGAVVALFFGQAIVEAFF